MPPFWLHVSDRKFRLRFIKIFVLVDYLSKIGYAADGSRREDNRAPKTCLNFPLAEEWYLESKTNGGCKPEDKQTNHGCRLPRGSPYYRSLSLATSYSIQGNVWKSVSVFSNFVLDLSDPKFTDAVSLSFFAADACAYVQHGSNRST
jgi:hypothetical protein